MNDTTQQNTDQPQQNADQQQQPGDSAQQPDDQQQPPAQAVTIPESNEQLPAIPADQIDELTGGSLALRIWFDPRIYQRAKQIARFMSRARGITPPHLLGQETACFFVVTQSLTWKLDPGMVAQNTYATPGGQVGYFGRLCQAILENSGRFDGPIKYQHYGDWSQIQGKFELRAGKKPGTQYAVPTWSVVDAAKAACGVTVTAKIKGESEPRSMNFDLVQAFPRNSTLWATDPKTQICYTAVRRFCSTAVPGIFMGIPFDREAEAEEPAPMKDVTPTGDQPRALPGPGKSPPSADSRPPAPKAGNPPAPTSDAPAGGAPAKTADQPKTAVNYVALADIAVAWIKNATSADDIAQWLKNDAGVQVLKKEARNLYTELLDQAAARSKFLTTGKSKAS